MAKDLGVPSKKLVDLAMQMGYPVKSHSSTIDFGLADRLKKQAIVKGLAKPKKAKKPAAAKKTTTAKKAAVKKPATAKKATPTAKPATKKTVAPAKVVAPKLSEEEIEERRKLKEEKAAEVSLKRKEAESVARRLREEDAQKRLKEKERRQKEAKDRKTRDGQAAKRQEEEKKVRAEQDRVEAEKKRIKREKDEERKKQEKEERELAFLIDEEEREEREAESKKIVIDEATTVKEFAEKLGIGVNETIKKLIMKGIMANLNQTMDIEVARDLAIELGYEIKTREEEEVAETTEEAEEEGNLAPRPPVVTIMGHVDHGKTSLLDTIRKTSVTDSEAGGITQRIGAYTVKLNKGTAVFLDTPGHEAFTAMRSRGAAVTDLVILVVAADDGVMPQTVEAIHHAKAAGSPVLVAVNKIDKPGANPDKVKQELAAHELIPEDWGGSTIFCEVSAKENVGIDHLLEMVLLQAEVLELSANPDRNAFGAIIESKLDKGRGAIATVLIQKGTLKVGDPFVAGSYSGKVRALIDDKGHRIDTAGPSIPVEVLGFAGVPNAGDNFMVVESERKANQIAISRQSQSRMEGLTAQSKGHVKLESLHAQITKGEVKDLNIIVKADVQGSIEAVTKAFEDIKSEYVRIRILHGAVGGITESDVSLAAASDAIIIGFNVRPTEKARTHSEAEDVDVRLYSVIYNAIDDIKAALTGMLEPEYKEVITGRVEVRDVFHIKKVGNIAGSMVTTGKIVRNTKARLLRDNVVIFEGKVDSLKRFKDDAKEVASGYECGLGLENYNDIKAGDVIEAYESVLVERKVI